MLPNLIIIGAQKCGTSALHYYLSLHPQIYMSFDKELHFFSREENWSKGIGWYESHFTSVRNHHLIIGEASPSYSRFPRYPHVPERMRKILPDIRLIYMVRDPVERVIANYHMRSARLREIRSIDDAYLDVNYVSASSYGMQLEKYLRYYSIEQFMIVEQQDLLLHRRETLRRIFTFLDVDPSFYALRYRRRINPASNNRQKTALGRRIEQLDLIQQIDKMPSKIRQMILYPLFYPFSHPIEKPTLSAEHREALIAHLTPDIMRFRQLTGLEFSNWSV